MLNLLPWRRRIRLPREKMDLLTLSGLSGRFTAWGGFRSSCMAQMSIEVMEDAGEREDEAVEVVLLLERPLKTERRLGLEAYAVERDRTWATCSGGSLEAPVEGRSDWSRWSGGRLTKMEFIADEADGWKGCMTPRGGGQVRKIDGTGNKRASIG